MIRVRRQPFCASGGRKPPEFSAFVRLMALLFVLGLLTLPLFAHGCHTGDHDAEPTIAPPARHEESPRSSG